MTYLPKFVFEGFDPSKQLDMPQELTGMSDTQLSEKMYEVTQWTVLALEYKVQSTRKLNMVLGEYKRVTSELYQTATGPIKVRDCVVGTHETVVSLDKSLIEAKHALDIVETYITGYDKINSLMSRELTRRLNTRGV